MKHYLKARRLVGISVAVFALELLLVVVGNAISLPNRYEVIDAAVAVPLQAIIVWVSALALRSESATLEAAAARSYFAMRVSGVGLITTVLVLAATVHCLLANESWGELHPGAVGQFAGLRALVGMWGAVLLLSAFVDARFAGVAGAMLAAVTLTIDPTIGFGSLIGFVLAPAGSVVSWVIALGLLLVGITVHIFAPQSESSRV